MVWPKDFINKIIHGDCLEVMKEIPDESIDLIVTDPPYVTTKESWDKKEIINQELSRELFRVAKDSCSFYVWCGIGEKSQSLIRWFPIFSNNWYFKDLITWKKQRGMGMKKGWLYIREEIMWFVKDNKKFIWNKEKQYSDVDKYDKFPKGFKMKNGKYSGIYLKNKEGFKRLTNVWVDITEESFDTYNKSFSNIGHYTPKPLKAIKRIIKLHTTKNDIVLDPFLGSGTTAIAAKQLGRRFIGIEKEKDYCKIANQRLWNEFGII